MKIKKLKPGEEKKQVEIEVDDEVLAMLDSKKLHPEESYSSVLRRAMRYVGQG